jgi:hypothetical protein
LLTNVIINGYTRLITCEISMEFRNHLESLNKRVQEARFVRAAGRLIDLLADALAMPEEPTSETDQTPGKLIDASDRFRASDAEQESNPEGPQTVGSVRVYTSEEWNIRQEEERKKEAEKLYDQAREPGYYDD